MKKNYIQPVINGYDVRLDSQLLDMSIEIAEYLDDPIAEIKEESEMTDICWSTEDWTDDWSKQGF